jgi:predicted DsbA family dithiol-disulfide isomerase
MHDIIFENQEKLDNENIFAFAQTIGLDMDRFKHDIQQKELTDKVEKDFESGIRSGVNRTPTFFINGAKFEGEWSENKLFRHLKNMLQEEKVLINES